MGKEQLLKYLDSIKLSLGVSAVLTVAGIYKLVYN